MAIRSYLANCTTERPLHLHLNIPTPQHPFIENARSPNWLINFVPKAMVHRLMIQGEGIVPNNLTKTPVIKIA